MVTRFMYFHTSLAKYGAPTLDVGGRQNAQSMMLAIPGAVGLFRLMERGEGHHRGVLAISMRTRADLRETEFSSLFFHTSHT